MGWGTGPGLGLGSRSTIDERPGGGRLGDESWSQSAVIATLGLIFLKLDVS